MDYKGIKNRLRQARTDVPEETWPVPLLNLLHDAGCFRHVIPESLGGLGFDSFERLQTYEAVAAEDLTCALILTQHDAACELLVKADSPFGVATLAACGAEQMLVTVGISQLTTSRRGGSNPAMTARPSHADDNTASSGAAFVMRGVMPWVTSASHASRVVTGAVLDDGRQILACVPLDAPGVEVKSDMPLMALSGSSTSEVYCNDCPIDASWVIRGPVPEALRRRAPVKSLTVTFVGLGMARRLVETMETFERLPRDLEAVVVAGRERLDALKVRLDGFAEVVDAADTEVPREALRGEVNALVNHLASAMLVLAKGSGFVVGTEPQRLYREASFLLVWSAPVGVQVETVSRLWPASGRS